MKNLCFALMIMTLISHSKAYAQDPVAPAQPQVPAAAPPLPDAPATAGSPVPTDTAQASSDAAAPIPDTAPAIPTIKHRDKPKPEKTRKSKYTSDRTEDEADHRVLDPIGMGFDRIVDLETDQVTNSKFVNMGNSAVAIAVPNFKGKFIRQIIIKGVGEGETNLTVRKDNGDALIIFDVTVAKQNLVRMLGDLKRDLREVEGIDIRIDGKFIVLEGEVLTPNDYGKVVNVVNDPLYSKEGVIANRIVMSPVSLNALAKKIETDLQVFAQTVRVSVLNGKIILEGTVESEAVKRRAAERAKWYMPVAKVKEPIFRDANVETNDALGAIIQNDIQVTPPAPKRESKLVRLTVHFVELSKDFLKTFGFKWQPGFTSDPSISIGQNPTGGVATGGAGGFTFSGTLSSLFPALNSAQSAGYGRVLKSVTSVVKSAEEYHVKDTQQIPTTAVGANGQTGNGPPVTVGLDMKITPTIMQGQDVDMNISMSQVDVVGKGNSGTPITASHDISTRVYMKSGEVSGITAVNNQNVATSFNRDDPNPGSFAAAPNAAPTRPLWNLLRSKNYTKARGQFVVFVSPQIVESASEGTEDLKKNYRMPSGH